MAAKVRRTRIGRYHLPAKAVNALYNYGIKTEADVDDYDTTELLKINGFGQIAASEINRIRHEEKTEKPKLHRGQNGPSVMLEKRKKGQTVVEAAEDDWLQNYVEDDEVQDGSEDSTFQKEVEGPRLIMNIGEEHGLRKRHIEWLNNIVKNGPADMSYTCIERVLAILVGYAMSQDPTRGGTRGVAQPDGSLAMDVRMPGMG